MWKNIFNFALAAAIVACTAAAALADEAQLLAVLRSNATQQEKADACRQLTRIATKNAVPTLATLLTDEKLSHMARYAMEAIPDPSVDAALRDAMGKVKGRLLEGVIGSLGVRRDTKAVEPMARLLSSTEPGIAGAAARALGKVGTPEAAKALEAAVASAPAASQVDFCEGLFRCAEALGREGHAEQSMAIYDRLRALSPAPQQVRAGALRGAILARQKAGVPLLVEALRGSDYVLTAAAARIAIELPLPEVTAALAAELPKLPVDKQVLVINTLGYRGDASAGPALLPLAAKGSDEVRLVAIRNLTHLAYAPVIPLLAELSLAGDGPLVADARACLGSFPGKDADATIAAMLSHKDAKVRGLAVELIALRSAGGSKETLLKAAEDADELVRIASLKVLRDQAGLTELPALLNILLKARTPAEAQAAETALGALCGRQSGPAKGNVVIEKAEYGKLPEGPKADVTKKVVALVKDGALAVEASNGAFGDPARGSVKKLHVEYTVNGVPGSKTVSEGETVIFTSTATPPAVVEALCAALARAKGEPKLALLRALRSAGGPKALETVNAAAADNDAEVKNTALRTLCDWSTPDALPVVAGLLKNPPTKTMKVLALRGYVRLVPQQDTPDAQKLEALKEAMALADRKEEKRLVLSALGDVRTAETLALVASHLENPDLKEEACIAAVTIGEKLVARNPAEVTAVMKQVAKLTSNKKLAARANAIVRGAKK